MTGARLKPPGTPPRRVRAHRLHRRRAPPLGGSECPLRTARRKQISPIDEHLLAPSRRRQPEARMQLMLGLDEIILDTATAQCSPRTSSGSPPKNRSPAHRQGQCAGGSASRRTQRGANDRLRLRWAAAGPRPLTRPLEPSQLARSAHARSPPHPSGGPTSSRRRTQERDRAANPVLRKPSRPRDRSTRRQGDRCAASVSTATRPALLIRGQAKATSCASRSSRRRARPSAPQNALHRAQLLDREGLAGSVRSRLHGTPRCSTRARLRYTTPTRGRHPQQISQRQANSEASGNPEQTPPSALKDARRQLAKATVRTLECYEHPSLSTCRYVAPSRA